MTPDLINAVFEFGGFLALSVSVRRLLRDRRVAGVSWVMPAFFSAWGVWNLYFYPAVGCPTSFVAGIAVVAVNALYMTLLIYFGRKQ